LCIRLLIGIRYERVYAGRCAFPPVDVGLVACDGLRAALGVGVRLFLVDSWALGRGVYWGTATPHPGAGSATVGRVDFVHVGPFVMAWFGGWHLVFDPARQ
jgi:hypothetical protein